MPSLLHELISNAVTRHGEREALRCTKGTLNYHGLWKSVRLACSGLMALRLARADRVAIYLAKQEETVIAMFGTSMAGGIFIPVNPLLKAEQVGHILRDSGARFLITSSDRCQMLQNELGHCPDVHTVILVDARETNTSVIPGIDFIDWQNLCQNEQHAGHRTIDSDIAAILYTSGSTGKPKGVVLSQRNMVAGAKSVSQYLENNPDDRILTVLPFSFDYGFSQLSTAFYSGACAVLIEYLLPRDVIRAIEREEITGLAAVPPLWAQLAGLPWPAGVSLRYMTNSGGAMPRETLESLRKAVPAAKFFLMYGLTEAFRSTYLPPDQLDARPGSIGKAIPNAEILVVNSDGLACKPGETGELVHRGIHVSLGYWNDPERTAERFRPVPGQSEATTIQEIAVWSGDYVRIDEEGYLYFIGRKDDMIKTSGYRVSPTEIEAVIYKNNSVEHVAAFGVPHPTLGQAIVAVVSPRAKVIIDTDELMNECKLHLPLFMVPHDIKVIEKLPKNPNGKIDRKKLSFDYFHSTGQPNK
jgi:acyl-CoA ligase (AMP-forming) (exosortase A-associated)